ncbi:MAG: hypothetical protein WCG03_09415 [Kiritimatiellales bacterium]
MRSTAQKLLQKGRFTGTDPLPKSFFERSSGMGFGNLLFFVVGFEVQTAEMRGNRQQSKKPIEAHKPLCL